MTSRNFGQKSQANFWRLVLLFFCLSGWSQGTAQEDRDLTWKGPELRKRFSQSVFRDRVEPHWISDSSFWYRITTGTGEHEYILIEAKDGKRSRLFDHQDLAQTLSLELNKPILPTALPIQNLVVDPQLKHLSFRINQAWWKYDLRQKLLTALKPEETIHSSLMPLSTAPVGSKNSSVESEILFVNHSRQAIHLFWRDSNGKRIPYSSVPAGESHRQHTFAGHVWEVLSPDGSFIAAFLAEKQAATAEIANDLQLHAPDDGRPASSDDSRSPDGHWKVEIRNHNVVLKSLKEKKQHTETALTDNGSEENPYSGRVYWSPDSLQFVVLQTEQPQKHPVYLVESSPVDQLQPRLLSLEYLKPGDKIPHRRPRLFDVPTQQMIPVSETLFPEPWSLRELHWERDSQRFTFLYNERGHQVLRLIACDKSGVTSSLIEETSSTFIDYNSKSFLQRLDASNEILWMSERTGWNHLWLYDAQIGQVKNQVTQGTWMVRSVEHVDVVAREVWFMASGVDSDQDPYYLHLCRVNFDGTGFVVLTAGDGTHEVSFSPDRQWFFDRWSRVDLPPVTELRRAADGQLVCLLEEANHQSLLQAGWSTPERFVGPGRDGNTKIYGIIIRPANFDPKKRYPVVEQIYAGPHGAHVPKSFGTLVTQQAMADLGFVIVQIDGMGTNWRGKRFHDVCWKNLADAGFSDRIAWIKAAAATRPWMDLNRVGIYGGSAGGQNAMRALIDHHDFYHVAVADCGCHDNRMDKIWWNELWMGYPVGPQYANSSNVDHAHKLQGQLLLIVGELDRNVDPASTMQVVHALQQANKDFEMLMIAGAGHGAAETPYGSKRRSDFLVKHLLGTHARPESR